MYYLIKYMLFPLRGTVREREGAGRKERRGVTSLGGSKPSGIDKIYIYIFFNLPLTPPPTRISCVRG